MADGREIRIIRVCRRRAKITRRLLVFCAGHIDFRNRDESYYALAKFLVLERIPGIRIPRSMRPWLSAG